MVVTTGVVTTVVATTGVVTTEMAEEKPIAKVVTTGAAMILRGTSAGRDQKQEIVSNTWKCSSTGDYLASEQ
jgi:hypothetical protein